MLFFEILVRFSAVLAYSNYVISSGGKRFMVVSQVACFCGASAGIVLGVKVDDGLLACQVFRTDLVAVLVYDLEIRHSVSNL